MTTTWPAPSVTTSLEPPVPMVEVKPAEEPIAPEVPITARVTFTSRRGVWSANVELLDSDFFITERDFNKLSLLLNYKRVELRKQANMQYHKAMREKAAALPSGLISEKKEINL